MSKIAIKPVKPPKRRALLFMMMASAAYACADTSDLDFGGGSRTPDEPPPSSALPEGGPSSQVDGAAPPREGGNGGACGDGTLDPGEECDDGNSLSDDGCSASCVRESAGPNDHCPGVALALHVGNGGRRIGSVTGTTAELYPHYAGSCGGYGVADAVYVVTPDVTGQLTARLSAGFDSLLYARRTCESGGTEAACRNVPGAQGGEELRILVVKDEPVYLFVDGTPNASGTFELDIELAAAACGNGFAESPEECDDGNQVAGDGCAPDCTLESVGSNIEDCPGQTIVLSGTGTAPRRVSFAGTTALMPANTLSGTAGCTASGPNTVYAITPDITGSMSATLVAHYDNAVVHIRNECDTVGFHSQLDCKRATEPLESIESIVPVMAGQPYYVIVDSSSSAFSGDYVLDVVVSPAQCGNGILDGNEQCDDRNNVSGDGCSATCTLEPVDMASNSCPGATLPLEAQGDGSHAGSLTSSTGTFTSKFRPRTTLGTCSSTNIAKDAAYVVTSPIAGLLTVTVSGAFDTMVYARTACTTDHTTAVDLGCSAAVVGNGPETLQVPVEANTPISLVIDGQNENAAGIFELTAVVTPAACGNGILEGGEACDDGNLVAGDGCSPTCTLEPPTANDTCQNAGPIALAPGAAGSYTATVSSGTTNLGHHQTFTGCASNGADAIYTVTSPIDGVLTAEISVASFNTSLGARSTCPPSTSATLPIVCSNNNPDNGPEEISFGVTKDTTYYLIVDGVAAGDRGTFTMKVNVLPPGCGDGLVSGSEQCDDGNTVGGDGCSATCMIEPIAGIDTCPGFTLPLTGTGNAPRRGVLTIDTTALAGDYAGTCGGAAKDGVVVVTPPIDGRLTARLTGLDYHAVLYARTDCGDPKSEIVQGAAPACDSDLPNPPTASRDVAFQVEAGKPYYLFVDGAGAATGIARLNVTVTP